jgi:hypothetical protein
MRLREHPVAGPARDVLSDEAAVCLLVQDNGEAAAERNARNDHLGRHDDMQVAAQRDAAGLDRSQQSRDHYVGHGTASIDQFGDWSERDARSGRPIWARGKMRRHDRRHLRPQEPAAPPPLRLVFDPYDDARRVGYEIRGRAVYDRLIHGVVSVVPPG